MRALMNERFVLARHTRLGFDLWNYRNFHRLPASLSSICNVPGRMHAMYKNPFDAKEKPCANFEVSEGPVSEGGYAVEACALHAFEHDCTVDPSERYSGEDNRKEGNNFW